MIFCLHLVHLRSQMYLLLAAVRANASARLVAAAIFLSGSTSTFNFWHVLRPGRVWDALRSQYVAAAHR
jgi:hypothetical protein